MERQRSKVSSSHCFRLGVCQILTSRSLSFCFSSARTRLSLFQALGSLGAAAAGVGLAWWYRHSTSYSSVQDYEPPTIKSKRELDPEVDQAVDGLPVFSLEEVAKHVTHQSGVWVMYGDGVYDITGFLKLHPGGSDNLLLAAGKQLEPFWQAYSFHNNEEVYSMLEEWRIGNVAAEDQCKHTKLAQEDHYIADPVRSSLLSINPVLKKPFCAETPTSLLVKSFLTPNDLFYIRNHFPVPLVDPQDFCLEISGEGIEAMKLTLNKLKTKFSEYTVTATLQCAGNRKHDLGGVKPLTYACKGGLIGTAEWTGVRLRDVLLYAGIREAEDYTPVEHVHFEGLDHDPLTNETYGASIPIHKAMDKRGDCLLAYKMNGEDIPRDHGYPLRAIVPGHLGARNVKWVKRIVASKEEHRGIWQQILYKGFPPSMDWKNMDASTAPAIQEMPVQSIIYSPEDGSSIESSSVTMSGIAWSGGGRGIVRVDVSCDGGKTWQTADLLEGSGQPRGRAWAWTLWAATVQVPSNTGEVELCCKAVDTSYNIQPDTSGPLWNVRGYLSMAWHRIVVSVKGG